MCVCVGGVFNESDRTDDLCLKRPCVGELAKNVAIEKDNF